MKTKLTTLVCLLVMCLFVVASLAGCQGLDGTNGTDGKSAYQLWLDQGNTGTVQDFVNSLKGETGAAGKGIASVARNDAGELVVTYTDGSSENLGKVVFEDPSVKCDHEFTEYELRYATCSEGGHVLNVCSKDCGYAYITYTEVDPDNHAPYLDVEHLDPTCLDDGYDKAICTECGWEDEPEVIDALGHDYNEGLSVIVTAPTCEKDGCITYTCQRCGDVDVEIADVNNNLFATGHDATGIEVIVVDEGANICIDGGQKLIVCETCFTGCTTCAGKIFDVEAIAPENHNVTAAWTVTTAPTFEATGVLTGACDVCGLANATVELPKLGAAYTKTSPVTPSCTTTGTDRYTYTYKGWTGYFDVVTTAVHEFNGADMPLDKVYAPHEVETVFGNAPATCLDASGKGSFTCDLCGEVYLVNVKGECEYTEDDVIEFVDSSCSQTGHKTYKCPTCEEEYTVTVPLKDHSYTGAPTVTGPTAGVITLTFKCDACEAPKVIECTNYVVDAETPTCARDYTTTYTYTYTDPNGDPQTDEFVVTHTKLAHYYYNGENVEIDLTKTYTLAELKTIFGDALTDLTTFGNVFTDCSTAGQVSFTCSGCNVPFLFNATGDHTWATETSKAPATCTTAGTITYTCTKDATHTLTVTDPDAPALNHNYALDAAASDLTTGKLKFVCANDATHKLDIDATWFEIVDTPATCLAGGSKVVNYKYNDPNTGLETAEKTATLQTYTKTDLHTHGTTNTIDLNKKYTISELKVIFGDALTGLNFFGNFPTTCQADVPASFVCDVCAQDLLILHVRGDHDWTDWTFVPAECGVDGYKYRTCETAGCDEREQEKTDDALEHIFNYALTEPTADLAGKVVVTCNRGCDYNKEYAIPAKGDAAYTWTTDLEANCQREGKKTAKYVVKEGETVVYTYTYSVITPVVEHENAVPPVEITWELNGYLYTGYYCGECKQMIVTNVEEIAD